MAKNTGKPSEAEFEDRLSSLGKAAYFYRIKDAAAIKGLTGRIGHVDKTPSDYIIVVSGSTEFAEVKSTIDQKLFPFSLLKVGQRAHGKRILAAGGAYNVYAHSLHHDCWFRIPLENIQLVEAAGRKSLSWTDMTEFSWC